jgi:hypothetical protein
MDLPTYPLDHASLRVPRTTGANAIAARVPQRARASQVRTSIAICANRDKGGYLRLLLNKGGFGEHN